MGSVVMSYSFDLEVPADTDADAADAAADPGSDSDSDSDSEEEGRYYKGMVPMADMLNADADRNNVGPLPPPSNYFPSS